MTTYLGKRCSFGLLRAFINYRQFMYLVISLLVLRAGCGIRLYQFLIIAYHFILKTCCWGARIRLYTTELQGMVFQSVVKRRLELVERTTVDSLRRQGILGVDYSL